MKNIFIGTVIALSVLMSAAPRANAEKIVILHTNDVHSNVDPDPVSGLGGALRRKAVVDSVRSAEKNVVLIDAGDAVQGSLYFMLFGGEVEARLMNAMGYDIAILGNHDFDNGMGRLAANLRNLDAEMISANYDFSGTELDGMFLPYAIRNYGDRKVAFIGLNVSPDKLIDASNISVRFSDPIATADKLAHLLKTKEGADYVVAVTHIGYTADTADNPVNDPNLARSTSDIDIIIGGHSHTTVIPGSPQAMVSNAAGKPVLIAQTGKNGVNMGEITIDTETGDIKYRLIPINPRLDNRLDSDIARMLTGYRQKVDSVSAIKIGRSKINMSPEDETLLNFASDVVLDRGKKLTGRDVDFSIMNKGGLRQPIPKGTITKGHIMNTFPFDNRVTVVEMPGDSVIKLLTSIAKIGGAGLSDGSEVTFDPATGSVISASINGKPIEPSRTYLIATIDYLAKGNDKMYEFAYAPVIARSPVPVYNEIIEYIQALDSKKGIVNPSSKARMHSH